MAVSAADHPIVRTLVEADRPHLTLDVEWTYHRPADPLTRWCLTPRIATGIRFPDLHAANARVVTA